MKAIISCIFCLYTVCAFSQDSIVVRKDSRLDMLNAKQASLNKFASKFTSNGLYRGYRLQVLNTRSRDQAYKMKAELLQRFPEQKSYVLFQAPYFKIRFGNFTDKEDALRYKNILAAIYPQGIYVVNDEVEYKPPREEETDAQ
ncbi:SPOR domain-containing protein [Ilyomonas limi]|jgi:hypothetical protein|uniref:SPOR domain-containing protein n=1 Tax=Ilyomonas limi TaxID=2575867 RepID=A0A4U3L4K6_9BACT|nr:SPOR domain-containing protein [Ilyomonas limi]TKK69920.1 SPOR domain-containing protein [Ilyomonas limi]